MRSPVSLKTLPYKMMSLLKLHLTGGSLVRMLSRMSPHAPNKSEKVLATQQSKVKDSM